MLGSLLHRGSRHDAHNQAHDHRWFVFKTIARRFTSVYLPREEDTVNALVDAGQKLKNPQMGLSETLVLVPQMWLMVNNDLLFLKLPLVGYATVPETQEHHLGYCIIYIYIHTRQNSLSRLPIQSYEIPTAVKSDERLPLDSWGYDFIAVAATASGADVGCARAGLWRLPEATRLAGRGQRSLAESHAPNQQIWYETMVSTGIISIVCKIRGKGLLDIHMFIVD